MCRWRFPAAIFALALFLAGCDTNDDRARESGDLPAVPTDFHAHGEFGPHGGSLVELGAGGLHGELVFDPESRVLTLHILNRALRAPVPLSRAEARLIDSNGSPPASLHFAAVPRNGETAESASRFATAPGELPDAIRTSDDLHGRIEIVADRVALSGTVRSDDLQRPPESTARSPASPGPAVVPVETNEAARSERTRRIFALLVIYCGLIILGSLGGGWLPFVVQLTHTRMQVTVSLVAGLMLGIGLFHMLPHAFAELGSLDRVVRWTMLGLLAMFFLIRAFHFHHHGEVEIPAAMQATNRPMPQSVHHHDHNHDCGHSHDHDHDQEATAPASAELHPPYVVHGHAHHHGHTHELSWVGVSFGLVVHTLIDGIALAASIETEAGHGAVASLFGLGTFLAIVLHKPLDAVSITSLMLAGGWSARARHLVNAGFALMCPLGAALFYAGVLRFSDHQTAFVGCALAFSAGVFLCISLGDLLPEVEFHSHDRVKLSIALLVGIALAWSISFLEPGHAHSHAHHAPVMPQQR